LIFPQPLNGFTAVRNLQIPDGNLRLFNGTIISLNILLSFVGNLNYLTVGPTPD